jgi:hypothetical protein
MTAALAAPAPSRSLVVGIDPGFGGGLAALDLEGQPVAACVMPIRPAKGGNELDVAAINAWLDGVLARGPIRLVVLEHVQAMPRDSRSGAFKFGFYFGKVAGIVETRGLPLELVRPQAWQRQILAGTKGKTKDDAIVFAGRRFPAVSLKATPRSTKDHDGIADALCLAEFARRRIVGKE